LLAALKALSESGPYWLWKRGGGRWDHGEHASSREEIIDRLVAIERVSGTLAGRKETFVLQHNGLMTRGEPKLSVIVVPDSGTSQLTGLAGTFTIRIEGGMHFYDFDYTLGGSK